MEVLKSLTENFTSFYESETIYSEFTTNLVNVLKREIEETKLKREFYNKIPSFEKTLLKNIKQGI